MTYTRAMILKRPEYQALEEDFSEAGDGDGEGVADGDGDGEEEMSDDDEQLSPLHVVADVSEKTASSCVPTLEPVAS